MVDRNSFIHIFTLKYADDSAFAEYVTQRHIDVFRYPPVDAASLLEWVSQSLPSQPERLIAQRLLDGFAAASAGEHHRLG